MLNTTLPLHYQKTFKLPAVFLCTILPLHSYAQDTVATATPTQSTTTAVTTNTTAQQATPSPMTATAPRVMGKEESIEYLKNNPAEMEKVLSQLILRQDAQSLKELLPVYAKYPQRDDSVIDWGNAIIAMKEGRIGDAIQGYRKVNAVLPNVKSLRFQLAFALYQDKQYKAAKNELEKLRSSLTAQADIDQINKYINAIDSQDKWNYDFNLNFLNDKNLTNAPVVGTSINNGSIVYTQPHEEGQGIGYSLGANKKWAIGDRYFASTRLGTYGKYYWDNKKFNEVYANIGAGIGYQNAMTEVELYPSFTQGWYGGGNNRKTGNHDLERYSENKALNLSVNHWLNPKLLYQNFSQLGRLRYEGSTAVNNMNTGLLSNSLVYFPKQTRSFVGGLDYLKGDNTEGHDGDSYDRWAVRLGWSEAWGRGISTRLNLGYGQRNYDAPQDFINIKRKNKEYDLGVSLWKRDFTLFKLTPRVTWNYHKVDSNSPFDEYSKNNINLEFTQTF